MDINTRQGFLRLATIVEGGTIVLALAIGWLVAINPWEHVRWTWPAALLGLAGTLPIFALYFTARDVRSVVVEMLGLPLSRCRPFDLVNLAALAGLGEELLFRGVLQPAISEWTLHWIGGWSWWAGFLGANIAFGLVHAITPTYALLATGIGMYFSWLAYGTSETNLLTAIIAHGAYDYIAFLLVIREFRAARVTSPTAERDPDQIDAPPQAADPDVDEVANG